MLQKLVVATVGALTAVACGELARSSPSPPMDLQLVALDHCAPQTRFDGRGGSLLPDAGWAPVEKPENPFAWAIDRDGSDFLVERPPADHLDLYAICRPYSYDGAPPQVMSVYRGEEWLASASLDNDRSWQRVRLALPDDALVAGANRLTLRFAYTTRPCDVENGNNDRRKLAVAFRFLAIVPRGLEEIDQEARATGRFEEGTLHLGEGMAATFPVRGGRTAELRLGELKSGRPDCPIRIQLLAAGGSLTELWSGAAAAVSGLKLEFHTPDTGTSRLRILHEPRTPGGLDPMHSMSIAVPEGFLTTRDRPGGDRRARPNVFIYLIDTLRADAVQSAGSNLETCPEIASFRADAVTYLDAWSASAWTLPSVVSILTGVYPSHHGVMTSEERLATDDHPPLAVVLGETGYASVAISQSLISSHAFGIDDGFDDFLYSNQLNGWLVRSQEVRGRLLHWLLHRAHPERPFMAFLHTVDPHAPYLPPPGFRDVAGASPGKLEWRRYQPRIFMTEGLAGDPAEVAHLHALYLGEVAHADRQFGRFLDMLKTLRLYDDSLVILVSDHGEEFGEHGGFDHGRTLYEELVHVPLIVKYPRSKHAGESVRRRVSLVDVAPTVLEVTGGSLSNLRLDGRSLARAVPSDRVVWAEVKPKRSKLLEAVDYRAVATGAAKCIENLAGNDQFGNDAPRWEAFDLHADPGERSPLPASSQEAVLCRRLLELWADRLGSPPGSASNTTDESTLDKLRALGYIE